MLARLLNLRHACPPLNHVPLHDTQTGDFALQLALEVRVEALDVLHILPLVVVIFGDETVVLVREERSILFDVIAGLTQDLGDCDGVQEAVGSVEAHREWILMVGLSKANHMVNLHVALFPIGDGDGDDGDVALASLTTCHAKGTLIYEIHFACDAASCYVEGLRG